MSKQIEPWKVLESRYILQRKWMEVREDRVELPTGVVIDEFHVLEYPDWVCVIPITEEGRFVLVRQYRHGVGRVCMEFPAGVIDEGESALEAAARELAEETGFAAREWSNLGRCAPEPSRHSNYAYCVVARGAHRVGEPAPEESENVAVEILEPDSLTGLLQEGHLIHGVHIAAIMMAVVRGELTL